MDSVFRIFFLTFLALSLAMTGFTGRAAAQMAQTPMPVSAGAPAVQSTQQSLPAASDEDVTILRDDYAGKYNPSTLENLSKLYWRLGAFDFEDNMAVGNYLKINDCKIYTEYLNDDLEWRQILQVMKDHLRADLDKFPLNYQFLLPVHLGRYDTQLGGFPLVDKTGFKDAKRISVDSTDRNREVCFDANAIKDYPKRLIILLPEPFTFDFLKLDEHVAQAYILRKKAEYEKMDDAKRVRSYERDAYLRLRVTFSQYHGNLRGEFNETLAILFGRIDGYEVFEDAGQKRLMASVDMSKNKSASPAQMSVPTDMQKVPSGVLPEAAPLPEAAVQKPDVPMPAPADATTPSP